MSKYPTYWKWLLSGCTESRPGYYDFINKYLFTHFFISSILSYFIESKKFSSTLDTSIIIVGSILIMNTFVWVGYVGNIIISGKIDILIEKENCGIIGFVYRIQNIFLVMFSFLIYVILVNIFEIYSFLFRFIFYFLMSFAIKESWSIIAAGNALFIASYEIRNTNDDAD